MKTRSGVGSSSSVDYGSTTATLGTTTKKPLHHGDEDEDEDDDKMVDEEQKDHSRLLPNIGSGSSGGMITRTEHLGKHRQYWRDIILGVNDGIISTYLLVAGVSGSGLSSQDILCTAIAGALAGSISMAAGEFIATKSQTEVIRGEIRLEQSHILFHKSEEMEEMSSLLSLIGIEDDDDEGKNDACGGNGKSGTRVRNLKAQLLQYYEQNPEALLKGMSVLEFGLVEQEERSPIAAAFTSGCLFFIGSLPSLLHFIPSTHQQHQQQPTPTRGLIWASALTIVALLLVGAIKTWATRGNLFRAAMENLSVAGIGGILAYLVGKFFDPLVH